jgi:O-antigen ligase
VLAALLGLAVAMFGGVYSWGAAVLAGATGATLVWLRPGWSGGGWTRVLDLALLGTLTVLVLQLVPLPSGLVAAISPARIAYVRATHLQSAVPPFLPLTLDPSATLHATLAAFCTVATFWISRSVFAGGGIRLVVTAVAWIATGMVLVALAQGASGTPLVYGFWRPYDEGARPFGPFINRNHGGTWSLLALMLCFGQLQWRRDGASPPRGWSWRARLAHAFNGRSVILVLAIALLAIGIALGASRSTLLALACAAGYVAWTARRHARGRQSALRGALVAPVAVLALAAYADVGTLLSRIDETRQLGLAQRVAIWRDTIGLISDFPAAGVGAGAFSEAMRVYQTSDRTYSWNEAHNEYLQVAAEGGLLLAVPGGLALIALAAGGYRARRRADHMSWMRLGASAALLAAAIQAVWETGLSLPANGMLAAVAAAILLHECRPSSHAAARS